MAQTATARNGHTGNGDGADIVMLEKTMVGGQSIYALPEMASHTKWATEVLERHPELSAQNAREILEQEIGEVFLSVLKDAGVFKRNHDGMNAFDKFIHMVASK